MSRHPQNDPQYDQTVKSGGVDSLRNRTVYYHYAEKQLCHVGRIINDPPKPWTAETQVSIISCVRNRTLPLLPLDEVMFCRVAGFIGAHADEQVGWEQVEAIIAASHGAKSYEEAWVEWGNAQVAAAAQHGVEPLNVNGRGFA